jgi:SAM-dependent methyltransferase
MEPFYPLHVMVCDSCLLVQLDEYVAPSDIFSEYAYFSSYSDSWVAHARDYVSMIIPRLGLTPSSQVVEIASNDGYLLQHFLPAGIPCLGVEPAANVAETAIAKGVPTVVRFFGTATGLELASKQRADLIIGNNVLAHVPDINDFVAGLAALLAPGGTVTMEFPHLLTLIDGVQFDTIYHEHFSYLSLRTVDTIFRAHALRVYDVESIPTHGGSLRIYACAADAPLATSPAVGDVLNAEHKAGLDALPTYRAFTRRVEETKRRLLAFLIDARDRGKHIAGYGAPGKGNTLLNYCGIRTDLLDYTVDRNVYKHGRFLPGTHIPVFPPEHLRETRPDYVLILPWNLRQEIVAQLAYIREWGGQFVVPIPRLEVF